MKNVEMKKKNAVKVFGASVLMAGTFILGGCGGSTTEKPKDEPTVEETPSKEEPTVGNKDSYEKMTDEETKLLKVGDVLGVDKLPNRELLEEMGLDYTTQKEVYKYVTTSDDIEEPQNLDKFTNEKTIDTYDASDDPGQYVFLKDKNGEFIWSYSKPISITIVEMQYVEVEETGEIKKAVTIGNNMNLTAPLCEEKVKQLQKK